MHGDMVRLVALDFILRLILGGVTRVALVVRIPRMDLDNPARDVPGLGIPGDVIAPFEAFCHLALTRKDTSRFDCRRCYDCCATRSPPGQTGPSAHPIESAIVIGRLHLARSGQSARVGIEISELVYAEKASPCL